MTTPKPKARKAACVPEESWRYRNDSEFRQWEDRARAAESPQELERIRWQYEHRRRVL